MLVILVSDLGKQLFALLFVDVVILHVVSASVAEHLSRHWSCRNIVHIAHHAHMLLNRIGTVGKLAAQRARLQFLEAERQHTVSLIAFDGILGQEESCRTS